MNVACPPLFPARTGAVMSTEGQKKGRRYPRVRLPKGM